MKLSYLKSVLILCTAIILLCKVSNVVSYLSAPSAEMAYTSSNDDATEKEEKKIESEYAWQQFDFNNEVKLFVQPSRKIIIPYHFPQLAYFSEVLTPPPSV